MANLMSFNGVHYAHKWIRSELERLEKETRQLATVEDARACADYLAFFHTGVSGHNAGEELVLWPALEAKVPQVTVPYALDHRADEQTFQTLLGLLAHFQAARGEGERADLARQINREAIVLNAAISHHANKEDVQIMPLSEEHFSREEKEALSGGMVAHLPRELMARAMPTLVMALSPDEREDHLRLMMAGMPAAAFRGIGAIVQGGIPAEAWAELVARIPELGG